MEIKISQLPSITALSANDLIYVSQKSGSAYNSRTIKGSDLLNTINQAVSTDLTSIASASGNWNSTYTTVNQNSATWVPQDISGKLNIDQTTPQTTVGAFNFPIVKLNTTIDDGYLTPLQVKGNSESYTCPDPAGLVSSPTYSEYYDLYGVSDNGSLIDTSAGSFIDDTFDIQIWSVATASDLTQIITQYQAVIQLTDSTSTPFQLDIEWYDNGGTLPTESYVVEIFQYSTGFQYWLNVGNVTSKVIVDASEFASWNSGPYSNNLTPYIINTGNLSYGEWNVYSYKTTNGVTVYTPTPTYTSDSDPNGGLFTTTLYWDDVGADGYILYDSYNYYNIDVGNVTNYIVDGLFSGWNYGEPTVLPIPYSSYADMARFSNDAGYGVVIGGQGKISLSVGPTENPIYVDVPLICPNLNADLVDGQHASEFQPAGTYVTSVGAVSPLASTGGTTPSISHLNTAGNKHIPTAGTANQIMKNSGSSGTGAWGTVTENAGALASISTIDMSGKFISTLQPKTGDTSNPPILMTSGDLTTIPQAGAVEFLTDKYYGTLTSTSSAFVSQYPPVQDGTYVKASTTLLLPNFAPYFATDPTKSLIGSQNTTSWTGGFSEYTNQRFHIDLGSEKAITKIYYENYHASGSSTDRGAKNFTIWGSNTAGSFNTLTYATDTGWTQLSASALLFDQHVASNTVDPKYINVANSTPYRYYAFKIADTYGTNGMGLRRIELQQQYPQRTEITLNDSALTSGRVPFTTTNGRLTDNANLKFDGTNLTVYNIKTDIVSATDLHINCGTDKTVVLDESVWDDLPPTAIINAKLGSTAPTLATFIGNIEQYTFDATNDYVIGATELTHCYKEGTAIHPHIHWATNGLDVTNRGVRWNLEYSIANNDNAFTTSTILSSDNSIPANTTDRTHYIHNFGSTFISGSGIKIGSYITWRLSRSASLSAAPANDPFAIAVGFHVEQDTLGSRTIALK